MKKNTPYHQDHNDLDEHNSVSPDSLDSHQYCDTDCVLGLSPFEDIMNIIEIIVKTKFNIVVLTCMGGLIMIMMVTCMGGLSPFEEKLVLNVFSFASC